MKFLFSALILLSLLSAAVPGTHAQKMPRREIFTYNVRIFIFPKAAQGTIRIIQVSKNRYRAELMAETTGIVGFLTRYRKNHYISEIEYLPGESRFFSRRHTKKVHRGANVERTVATIDQEEGKVNWKIYDNDELKNEGTDPIPGGVQYEDLLSAFFNFRNGAYGPLEAGRKMTILALPDYAERVRNRDKQIKEDPYQKFEIRIPDAKSEAAYRKRYGRTGEKGTLALVKVPKNLFGQQTGEIRIWFDENVIPLAATVEDAIFFGDVHGTLRQPGAGP